MNKRKQTATVLAFLAAVLYALNAPLSKLLLHRIAPTMMAAFLYLGAGLGLLLVSLVGRLRGKPIHEQPLTVKELPFTVGMILLDITAPISLMVGLTMTTAANASLLNNFEIVATSLIALFLFRETISRRLWCAIALVTLASLLLSFEDMSSFSFSYGSLFVLLACIFWGFENNCTRKLSAKDPTQIVTIKGLGSGMGSLLAALLLSESLPAVPLILGALALGFVAYGLSIYCYIYAQRDLGAAKTSTYYAAAPFVGAALSLLIFTEWPSPLFLAALAVMMLGTYFAVTDSTEAS